MFATKLHIHYYCSGTDLCVERFSMHISKISSTANRAHNPDGKNGEIKKSEIERMYVYSDGATL